MHYQTSFLQIKHDRWRNGRKAVAVICLLMVCLLAGISAVHAHAVLGAGTAVWRGGEPCELCAIALQAALLFAIYFSLLHLVRRADRAPADPKPKSQFLGTSLWCRPPPLQF